MIGDTLAVLGVAIENASPVERAALVIQLAARLARLGAGLAVPAVVPAAPTDGDRNLSVDEAARWLGMSRVYLYRHARELGAVQIGRRLLFPERGLAKHRGRHA